jgi:hypothetical protein
LETFRFDVTFSTESEESREATRQFGTKEFTAQEPKTWSTYDLGSATGPGSGSVMNRLRNAETAQTKAQNAAENNKKIRDILERLTKRPSPRK